MGNAVRLLMFKKLEVIKKRKKRKSAWKNKIKLVPSVSFNKKPDLQEVESY